MGQLVTVLLKLLHPHRILLLLAHHDLVTHQVPKSLLIVLQVGVAACVILLSLLGQQAEETARRFVILLHELLYPVPITLGALLVFRVFDKL